MKYVYRNLSIIGTVALGLFLVNCGGTPDMNPLLEEAQTNYQQMENDTLVVRNAPVALEEAEEAVAQARQTWEQGKDKEVIDHQAYIAKQRVAIARQTALLNAAQDEVKRTESERQRVLIEARQAEAKASERRAEQARKEAQKERAQAEAAREEAMAAKKRAEELAAEAEKLSKRVNELEAQQTERGLVLTLGDVLFDFGKAQLKPGGNRAVSELTNFLREYSERNIMIEGFTDSVGSESYNQDLSRQRADAVRQALMNNGISGSRIQIRGYGEEYAVASNNTEAGRQRNRRVEVIVSDKDGQIEERGN